MNKSETLIYFSIGTLNILSSIFEIEWLNYLSKPLLMLSLAYFYYQQTKNSLKLSDKIMILALIFSCLGDTFLMFQKFDGKYFLFGLASFLLAQLSYSYIFGKQAQNNHLRKIPFLVYSGFLVFFLLGKISADFKIPIIAYASVITLMGMMAVSRKTNLASYQNVLAGAILFIISDSLIAVNKFYQPIWQSGFWIMLTYIVAQYLIMKGFLLGRKV